MNAYEIAHSLMARPRRNGPGWLVLCPAHGDKHPSLSIRDGEGGKLLVKCFVGCDGREILKTLREMGLLDGSATSRPVPPAPPAKDRADLLDRFWEESESIESGKVAAKYLVGRGIILSKWPSDIQEHPSLAVYEDGEPTGHRFPALIAVIRNGEGRPAGLHITFLKEDGSGKAPIESPRRIIGVREGSTRGGAVRLFDPRNGEIGLAEGLETAFSAYLMTGTPTWAALNAGGIERAVLPEEIRRVTIFADRDGAGLKSAALACERFRREGREVEILAPSEQGQDFNDILLKQNAHQTAI